MKVKDGYKQTEVGVIPEDWEVKEFVDVMDGFSSGQTPYRAIPEFYKGDIPWITSGELNYNIITDTIEKITIEGASEANLKTIPKGTFLFAITGLEAAGTRGSCAITGIDATTNQSCMALYPKKGLLITPYLYHYYVRYGNELAFKFCQGTKQQSYTGAIAKKLPIIVPPTIAEQTAIATALTDTDDLIRGLEKLIEKKRAIKQGAMQELLQPKEGWEVKKLGEVCEIYGRIGFRGYTVNDIVNKEEGAITISPSNLQDDKMDFTKCTYISWFKYEESPEIKIYNGDILLVKTGSTSGKTAIIKNLKEKATINPQIVVLKNILIDNLFLSYVMSFNVVQNQIITTIVGGAIPTLSQKQISNFKIPIPKSIIEQIRIATILSDMDEEIGGLELKLEKYKQLKMGMMQELLTGKIRLV